jgi:hypothetical protein
LNGGESSSDTVTDRNPLRGTDWDPLLRQEFEKTYWGDLQAFVDEQRWYHDVYPPPGEVLTALHLTALAGTKVVILGQDPYHGHGQAHGLAFSVRHGFRVPPSLRNIHRELHDDVCVPIPDHGSLESWASRGVLLLNATLTVREGSPRSHRQRMGDVHRRGHPGRRQEALRGFHSLGKGRPAKEEAHRHVPARGHLLVAPVAPIRKQGLLREQAVRSGQPRVSRRRAGRDRLEVDAVNHPRRAPTSLPLVACASDTTKEGT